jgi:hypothetical protein
MFSRWSVPLIYRNVESRSELASVVRAAYQPRAHVVQLGGEQAPVANWSTFMRTGKWLVRMNGISQPRSFWFRRLGEYATMLHKQYTADPTWLCEEKKKNRKHPIGLRCAFSVVVVIVGMIWFD